MSVPILSCPCGLRMKAKGATPGRVGRCPRCGEMITVTAAAMPKEEAGRGYGMGQAARPAVAEKPRKRPSRPVAEVPALVPEFPVEVEPWWRPALMFPARGAEGLMMVGMMGLAFWVSATLVPELCIGFVADATFWGAALMGYLISLIVALPALALGTFAVAYTLQYLGRVLVSAAMGEVVTPRPPDRNFDRLTDGLGPWLAWLACGATLGLGPLLAYSMSRTWNQPASLAVELPLAAVGLPYALMALMRTLLHESAFPSPFAVAGTLARFNVRFLAACAVEFGLGLAVVLAFSGVLKLREVSYWVYLPLMLPCWLLAVWAAIVGMRVLGVFYHHHASALRWFREKPWWAVPSGG